MKRTVSFRDISNMRVIIDIERTRGHISFSGEYNGTYGQIVDSIKPASMYQQILINVWKKYHLQTYFSKRLEQALEKLIRKIEDETRNPYDLPVTQMDTSELSYICSIYADMNDTNASRLQALAIHLEAYVFDIEYYVEGYNSTIIEAEGREYMVCTPEEVEDELLTYHKNQVDELGFDGYNQNYVRESCDLDTDGDIIIRKELCIDNTSEERGSALGLYDGIEYEQEVNGVIYYIYKR